MDDEYNKTLNRIWEESDRNPVVVESDADYRDILVGVYDGRGFFSNCEVPLPASTMCWRVVRIKPEDL